MHLGEVAALVSGTLENGSRDTRIAGIQDLQLAGEHDAAFLSNMRLKYQFNDSRAGVILLGRDIFPDTERTVIRVDDPYLAFAVLQRAFYPAKKTPGVLSKASFIDSSARLADDVGIAAMAVIGHGVEIGPGSRIGPGCVIEAGAVIGSNCLLHARAIVREHCILGDRIILGPGAVIGSDGFGYAWSGKEHLKIPQVGRVVVEDDVEIGANTCVDRGAIGDTVIGQDAKLDNLIQIGHNVKIGAHSIMASQVGISGSTVVGESCQFGGQAGLAGHLKIGNGCKLAAKTGVMADLPDGVTYAGIPAMPHRLWLKTSALAARLPEMWKILNKFAQKD